MGITDRDKVKAILQKKSAATGKRRSINEEEMKQALKAKVRGQDHVIDDMVPFIRRNWGKAQRKKPVGSFLFLGPPGTGKSELAKATTAYLFGDSRHILQFDCQDFSGPEAKNRLIGVPRGYKGDDEGGQLTRPMMSKKDRLILFDEVTRAWSGVFELFFRMLDEGRLQEAASNREADFTESVIIFTSNAEYEAAVKLQTQLNDVREVSNRVKDILKNSNVFDPALLTRVDKVYVFKPLDQEVLIEVAELKAQELAKEYNLDLDWVDPQLIAEAVEEASKASEGPTREMARVVTELLGDALMNAQEQGFRKVRLTLDEDGDIQVEPLE